MRVWYIGLLMCGFQSIDAKPDILPVVTVHSSFAQSSLALPTLHEGTCLTEKLFSMGNLVAICLGGLVCVCVCVCALSCKLVLKTTLCSNVSAEGPIFCSIMSAGGQKGGLTFCFC